MAPSESADSPIVTVITVCFNLVNSGRARLFHECLQSVHGQDYPKVEHLVIDGGSTDGTPGILREFSDKGWIRYISEPDNGIYDAMNKGISLARGKYIAFLNSDDYWHDCRAISVSVEALERTGAAFSYAPRRVIQVDGTLKYTESASLGVFPLLMPFCHQTMFTCKEVLQRHGGFDDLHFKSAADYDLVFRMLISGEDGVYVPMNFTSFRLCGFSDSEGKQVGQNEMKLSWQRHLGQEAAAELARGVVSDSSFLYMQQKASPRVAHDLLREFVSDSPGQYHLRHGLIQRTSEGYALGRTMLCEEKRIRLFGKIPLLTVKIRTSRTDWWLFEVIPLLRRRDKRRVILYLLFFFIPLVSIAKQR